MENKSTKMIVALGIFVVLLAALMVFGGQLLIENVSLKVLMPYLQIAEAVCLGMGLVLLCFSLLGLILFYQESDMMEHMLRVMICGASISMVGSLILLYTIMF